MSFNHDCRCIAEVFRFVNQFAETVIYLAEFVNNNAEPKFFPSSAEV